VDDHTETVTGAPGLSIVYRSHGGENLKARPPYYSKLLALTSVVRAAHESGLSPRLIFSNDGPIPADRLDVMRAWGRVAQVDKGSNRESYRAAIGMVTSSSWPSDDVVWFAEDDYLYRPESFRMLMAAAAAIPQADYLSMVGGGALDQASPRTATRRHPRRGAADVPDAIDVAGVSWFRGVSTTSTFGARLGVLREDARLLRQLPYSGGAWDHTTCLTVQGRQPFSWAEVRGDLQPGGSGAALARGAFRASVRAGTNLRSLRRPDRRRLLYLCDPVGTRHLELPGAADGLDWERVADETRAWGGEHGITVPARLTGGTAPSKG